MIIKHQIYFVFFKIWCHLNLIYKGRFVYYYSEEKEKWIKGVVTSFEGVSVTRKIFGFEIGVNWLEPLQGYNSKAYTWGAYDLKSYKKKLRSKPLRVDQLKIGDYVWRLKSNDEVPQWRKTKINSTYKELIRECPSDYKVAEMY